MPRFVVHKHQAKKAGLHYDLRLEVGKYLESYAIRKGIPLKSGVKHLAIKQPNHTKWWLTYEGDLSSGYGAGHLEIWDSGTYKLLSSKESKRNRILEFNGKKLKGKYYLIKLGSKDNYIIFKGKE